MSVCVGPSQPDASLFESKGDTASRCYNAKHTMFLASMKICLRKQAQKLSSCIGRCGRVHLVGSVYKDVIDNALNVMRAHADKLIEGCGQNDAHFFVFVLESLALDGAFRSLCSTWKFSPYEPLEQQNKEVWLLCRALFELPVSCAHEAGELLCARAPACMAMCGFLALMTRTPLALAIFAHDGGHDGVFPIAHAACCHVDPVHSRPLVSVVSRCVIGTNELFSSDVCQCILVVDKQPSYTGKVQLCVKPADADTERESLEEIAYADQTEHGIDWLQLSALARSRLCECTEDGEHTKAWSTLWESVVHTAEMAYRVICRRSCVPFAVLWVHTQSGFVCFARQLNIPGDYARWVESCARELEDSVRSSFAQTDREPQIPISRHSKKYARDIRDRDDRWNLECCDSVSESAMATLKAARNRGSSCFMTAQGSFRGVVSVCFVSCRL